MKIDWKHNVFGSEVDFCGITAIGCDKWQVRVAQLCPTLCNHMVYRPWNSPGQNTGVHSLSLLHGIFPTRDWVQVSHVAGTFFTNWATREARQWLLSIDNVEYWLQGSSKSSPGRYSFGTSQIMYSRITFCSSETCRLPASAPFGEHWLLWSMQAPPPSLEEGELVQREVVW